MTAQQREVVFAWTQAVGVQAERHLGVRAAVALIRADELTVAYDVLCGSVERQALLAGCGSIRIGGRR